MKVAEKIRVYQFQDSIAMLQATPYGNLLLLVLLAFGNLPQMFHSVHVQACFLSFIIFLLFQRGYDWRYQPMNALLAVAYLGICLVEYLVAGLPDYPAGYEPRYGMSKGIMFDLMMWSLPYVYICIRVSLVIPIFGVIYNRSRLLTQ